MFYDDRWLALFIKFLFYVLCRSGRGRDRMLVGFKLPVKSANQ
jgi:hypothetical protein